MFPPGGNADDRTSGYDSFTGLADYDTFFDAVNLDGLLEKKPGTGDDPAQSEDGGE